MRRRTVIKSSAFLAFGALSSFALGGCGDSSQTAANSDEGSTAAPLRIALVPWLGWGRAQIAEVKGFFAEEGIEVEQTVFQTVSEVNTALLAKKVDMAWAVAADLVVLSESTPDLKYIMASDYSGEVDAVLGRGIPSAEDARDKKFAREDVPYMIVFMGKYLESVGLTDADVELLPLSVPDGSAALIAGNVDGVATYEPFLSTALEEGQDVEVLFSAKGTNIIANGLIAHGEVLASRREDVLAYLRALNKAMDFAQANPDEANEIVGDWVGLEGAEVAELMTKIDILDLEANKEIAFNPDNALNIANSIDSAAPILIAAGKATEAAPGESFVDASFVEEL